MRLLTVKLLILSCAVLASGTLLAQNAFSFYCTRDTAVSGCGSSCFTLKAKLPDIRFNTGQYSVNPIIAASSCIPVYAQPNDPGGTSAVLITDDRYSSLIPLPFPFYFYNGTYNQLTISTNGYLSFDHTKANSSSHFGILASGTALSASSGTPQNLPSSLYDRGVIMGPYHDIDPSESTSPNRTIQYQVVGNAPYRKWVLSFYKIPLYSPIGSNCNLLIENTHQIILYESTGIVEVLIFDKEICTAWNQGRAMVGMQSLDRTNGIMAPGRAASDNPWGNIGMNEGWRFVPAFGGSAFLRTELHDLAGNVIATGTTANLNNGLLEASFPNICPPVGTTTYIVKSWYIKIDDHLEEVMGADTVRVTRSGSADLGASAIPTPTACGPPTGTITVTVPVGAGTAPYHYSLNGGPTQTSNIFNNVPQGNHVVTVTDNLNICSSNVQVMVTQSGSIAATPQISNTSCPGINNGSVSLSPTNGTAPYQYSLNGGPLQASNLFSNLAPGNYTVTVTDNSGCSGNIPVIILAGAGLTTTSSKTDVLCSGGNSGSITVNQPSSGTQPFSYSIDNINWQPSNIFTGLVAGVYTVRVRDASNCQGQQNVTINQPTVLGLTPNIQPVKCYGEANGVLTLTGAGGVSPYQYSVDGISFQSSGIFNLAAGTYTAYIRDNNNCQQTITVSVTQPPLLTATTQTSDASCDGGNDGVITVTAAGGNGGYQYSVNGNTWQTSNVLNVGPGNYNVSVKDVKGCIFTLPATVDLTNNLSINQSVDETICEGSSVQLRAVSNATQYSWAPSTGLSSSNISNPVASPIQPTQYVITATLGRCVTTDTIFVNVNAAPKPDAGVNGDICYGQSFMLQGSGGTVFNWTPSTFLDNSGSQNPVSTPDNTITYSLSVVDALGCPSLTQDQVTVRVTPPIRVQTNPSDTIVHAGDKFQLRASSAGDIYKWFPATGLDNANVEDPIVTIDRDIIYTVEASSSAGCKGEATVVIKVYKGPDIYVPTAFSPNRDGKNDVFKPFPVGIKQLNYFVVYNRWGQEIFSTKSLHQGWDGSIKGMDQAVGVYVWMIQAVTTDGNVITKKGTVTLVR